MVLGMGEFPPLPVLSSFFFFFLLFCVLVAGLIMKSTPDRLRGEKETNFNSCAQSPHRNGTSKTEKASSFDIL